MSNFLKQMQKDLGESLHVGTLAVDRWSSGFFSLNNALGGGIPAGRATLMVGKGSTGKSTISAKTAANVNSTNWETGEICEPASEGACKVLYVDQEGTLDKEYCEKQGYFPDSGGNVVVSTDTGNQCVDLINAALQSNEFSLIVLDSIEALVPYRDLEKSSESMAVGSKAKLVNDACRRWTIPLISSSREVEHWWQRPTLLLINQLREAIGSVPMPPQIPSGIGQTQLASIIIQMNSPKYEDDGKLASFVNFRGVVKKNKLSTPRGGFECRMAVKNLPEQGMYVGSVDNATAIIKDVRKHNIWEKKEDGMWHLFNYVVDKQSDFLPLMQADPAVELDIMQKVIKAMVE